MIGEADIRRDKGCNFVVEDDVEVEEDSHWSFQEKESNYEPNTVDHSLEDIESKDVQNAADEVDIRIDKDKYDGSGDDMEIEEDSHQIYQKEEHNLQTYAEDNGLTNICKMTVALECSEVSAFEVSLYIKSFHFIYSLILLLKTYRLVSLPFSVKIASIFFPLITLVYIMANVWGSLFCYPPL